MRIILQPCGNKDAREHYKNTIKIPVRLDNIRDCLSEDEYAALARIYPDGLVQVWGVTPGATGGNISKWNKIEPGDVTLLAATGKVFASAVATYKTHNKKLAEHLWGFDIKGQTWEYVYFVSEVYDQDISYVDLNKIIPYSENFVIQGFSVLNELQSENVFTSFGFYSETFYPPVSQDELPSYLENEGSLDSTSTSISRKEQSALRYSLFNNEPFSNCSLCNKDFPVSFLVAAHVKKRAECTKEERLDFKNIATPMCKFGCDELYEKGVVGVKSGKVARLKDKQLTRTVEDYISAITDNLVSSWDSSSSKYYDWHVSKHSR